MTIRRKKDCSVFMNRRDAEILRFDRRRIQVRRRTHLHESHSSRESIRRTLRKNQNGPLTIRKKHNSCKHAAEISEVRCRELTERSLSASRRSIQWSAKRESKKASSSLMMNCNPAAFTFCTIDERNQRVCWNVISDHLQQVQRTVGRLCLAVDRMWTGDVIEKPSWRWKTADHRSKRIRLLIWIVVNDTWCEEVQSDWRTAWILSDDIDWRLTWKSKKIHCWKKMIRSDLYARYNKEPMYWQFYFVVL